MRRISKYFGLAAALLVMTAVMAAGTGKHVFAEQEVGTIKNASIDSNYILRWDAYPGTDLYWVELDMDYAGGGAVLVDTYLTAPGKNELDLKMLVDERVLQENDPLPNNGDHTVSITATKGEDSTIIAKTAVFNFDYKSDKVPYAPPNYKLNATITSDGILKWDMVHRAYAYDIQIDDWSLGATSGVTEMDLKLNMNDVFSHEENEHDKLKIKTSGVHDIVITAFKDEKMIEYYDKSEVLKFNYTMKRSFTENFVKVRAQAGK